MCVHKHFPSNTLIFLTQLHVTAFAYANQVVQEGKCFSIQCAQHK